MNKILYSFSLILIISFYAGDMLAQYDTSVVSGVTIKVPVKEKKKNSYIFLTGGFQNPTWYKVPVIPEFPVNMVIKGSSVKASGWFAGFGIMKKSKKHFEVGLLADFYKTTIPVAYSGQRATGEWVTTQTPDSSSFTDVFTTDMKRVSEVISLRASVRYKIPVGKIQFWGGIAPGTYSCKVYFPEGAFDKSQKTYVQTTAGISFQTGINFIVRDKLGKDMLRFTFYSDFSSPKIEEKMAGLIKPDWIYKNTDRNYAISPVRFGFAIGFH